MNQICLLIGGRTGDGIPDAGMQFCRLFAHLGYHVYMNSDYPSIIVGGHHFVIIRASTEKIAAHTDETDALIAFNQDALDLHQNRLQEHTCIVFRSDRDQLPFNSGTATGLDIQALTGQEKVALREEQLILMGAMVRSLGISKKDMINVWFQDTQPDQEALDQKAAVIGYDHAKEFMTLDTVAGPRLPVRTGTDAISLGLLQAGLQAYTAYPMTPTSPILEFMARHENDLGIQVSLPESEIAVMMQALGYAYMGIRTAVGTSGGGFSLMVEALSLSGQAELPVVIVMGQRAGPGTGMPTYTAQSDLAFVLAAGHGEFPRLVVAPGDAEEAFTWSALAMNLAWKYQIPAFILVDKTLCLNAFSFDRELLPKIQVHAERIWDENGTYLRYLETADGVSPLMFPPRAGQAIKSNSYVHDEYGLTSEEPHHASGVVDKRFRKVPQLLAEIEGLAPVQTEGKGSKVLLTWGSCSGACQEVAQDLNLRLVQILVINPLPVDSLTQALDDADQIICVEQNQQGQLANYLIQHGFKVHHRIGKYDGRPFSVAELKKEVKKVIE
jgi:2-oxoglutarate/2-oxoacid ferredoxin oxidoreductase subunit alpha